MNYHTDCVIMFLITIALICYEAVKTLLFVIEKGIFKDEREMLMCSTKKELQGMLEGVKGTSSLNKAALVERVLEYQGQLVN